MKGHAASVFDLWDTETGNLIGTFETEKHALKIVHDLLFSKGIQYADALDLGIQDATGNSRSIATGPKLATMAGITDQARPEAAVTTAVS